MADSKDTTTNCQLPTTAAKLLVIVGPTASGKSDLAMKIAKLCNGEIICADSRTVYKGLDIGTAKPTIEEQRAIPHHLLDVVLPDQMFTAADFKVRAERAIEELKGRGRLPILVGGSGLYIDAVLYDYAFSEPGAQRDAANERHLAKDVPAIKKPLRTDAVIVGLHVPRDVLKRRIAGRIDKMLEAGFLDEVRSVQAKYPNSKALLAPGYKAFADYLNGQMSLDDAKALFIKNDSNLAKRQMTWFKRNKNIHWLEDPDTYTEHTISLLNKLH